MSDQLDAQLESSGGLYHACTARVANGVDADLPTRDGIGCRIERVPIQASPVFIENADEAEELGLLIGVQIPGRYHVVFGDCGTGYMLPTYEDAASIEAAEAQVRNRLLSRGGCFRTRPEAKVAVEQMLSSRASDHID